MVAGLAIFRKYFESYPENYVIIGGAACDVLIDEVGLIPRTTKDIDIILIIEALSADFVQQFWQFIKDGNYHYNEKSADKRQYYRFKNPKNSAFPYQVELFSRTPDLIVLPEDAYLTPIPVDDDLSSLSAILLNDEYYNFIIGHSQISDGLHLANIEALICLKIVAYLEIKSRLENGSQEDSKHMKKHKADIFRLAVILTPNDKFELPSNMQNHIKLFTEVIEGELPEKSIFKEMGLGKIDMNRVFEQLKQSFDVTKK